MISNRHRTKLVSLKHVVRWRLSLAFSIFITLRKTKLPVNAKKSRRNQSPREAACTEIFVLRRFGFLISQPSIRRIFLPPQCVELLFTVNVMMPRVFGIVASLISFPGSGFSINPLILRKIPKIWGILFVNETHMEKNR